MRNHPLASDITDLMAVVVNRVVPRGSPDCPLGAKHPSVTGDMGIADLLPTQEKSLNRTKK